MSLIAEKTEICSELKASLGALFPYDVFQTWFADLTLESVEGGTATLGVKSDFAAIWVQDNYMDVLSEQFEKLLGSPTKVALEVKAAKAIRQSSTSASADSLDIPATKLESASKGRSLAVRKNKRCASAPAINPENTFKNFVVGPSNQLAYAACLAAAKAPGKSYNPLFIYGDTGLGKTHLMHAVAHYVLEHDPSLHVEYLSTEKFTNEFISAIQENKLAQFRKKYRAVDVLLIDDIQFLAGKERIQEEFFHTFNELYESQKQVILCSDRPASEIRQLESRLVSRFQWGLVADVQAPEFETRYAILKSKVTGLKLNLPADILQFLAKNIAKNVRRMEGALTRVAGYVSLMEGADVSLGAIERLLKDILQDEAKEVIDIEHIQRKVCDYFKISHTDMLGKRRPMNIAFPRQIAMYLCRALTDHSLKEIGRSFGGRDHGTVIHACKAVDSAIGQDEGVRRNVEYVKHQLTCAS